MPIRRHAATLAVALALPAAAAHALPPPSLVVGALPRGGLMAAAVLRVAREQTRAAAQKAHPGPAQALRPLPTRERAGIPHRDLDDMVRDRLGGRVTYYFGRNLAAGDASGVKTFGLKFYFK